MNNVVEAMESDEEETKRFCFTGKCYNETLKVTNTYKIYFERSNQMLEIIDACTGRRFTRETYMPDVRMEDFYIGAKLNLFGRFFDIISYADEWTTEFMEIFAVNCFVLVKHCVMDRLGRVIRAFTAQDARLANAAMTELTPTRCRAFLTGSTRSYEYVASFEEFLAGPVTGLYFYGENLLEKLITLKERRTHLYDALNISKGLRSIFDDPEMSYGLHIPITKAAIVKEMKAFFHPRGGIRYVHLCHHSTAALILPHAVKAGYTGKIIRMIQKAGFTIHAMRMQHMSSEKATKILSNYFRFYPYYPGMVRHFVSGTSIALEIGGYGEHTYVYFRSHCGPKEPPLAQVIQPESIRGLYGRSNKLNAIYCTDNSEHIETEIRSLFT